ncbi:MAG: hypothetical protein Q4D52_00140 [Eubacteriales bacterium]|nr:hypothetical protein [Eubacteriales bacterium]
MKAKRGKKVLCICLIVLFGLGSIALPLTALWKPGFIRMLIGKQDELTGQIQDGVQLDLPEGALEQEGEVSCTKREDGFIEVKVEGQDHVRLNQSAVLTIDLGEPIDLAAVDRYVAVYQTANGERFYIEPDRERLLEEGKLSFETYHFSLFGAKKLTDQEQAQKYAHQMAVKDVMLKAKVDAIMNDEDNEFRKYIDGIYTDLGVKNEEVKKLLMTQLITEFADAMNGVNTNSVINFGREMRGLTTVIEPEKTGDRLIDINLNPEKMETVGTAFNFGLGDAAALFHAAKEGDITGFNAVLSDKVIEGLAAYKDMTLSSTGKNIAVGVTSAIPEALVTVIEDGDYAEASKIVLQSTAGAMTPVVGYVQLEAALIDAGITCWKDHEVEMAYRSYAGLANEGDGGYRISADDMDGVIVQMRGAFKQLVINKKKEYAQVNNCEVDEINKDVADKMDILVRNELKQQFEKRKEKENEISEQEKKYQGIIESLNFQGSETEPDISLLTRGKHGFDREDDLDIRLRTLLRTRSRIVEMLGGEDSLYDTFGTNNIEKQNYELSWLVKKWIEGGNAVEGQKAVLDEINRLYKRDLRAEIKAAREKLKKETTTAEDQPQEGTLSKLPKDKEQTVSDKKQTDTQKENQKDAQRENQKDTSKSNTTETKQEEAVPKADGIDAFMGEWYYKMDHEGSPYEVKLVFYRNGENVIIQETNLPWHLPQLRCTEYEAEYDEKTATLKLTGLTFWLEDPDSAERKQELGCGGLVHESYTAAEVDDYGSVIKLKGSDLYR